MSKKCQLDVVLVFIAIADNQRITVHVDRQHRMQFGFGACFQSEVELLAMLDDLLYHGADLVDLDGIDDEVLGIVTILLCCLIEASGSLLDTVVYDIGKTHQHGG